MNQSDTPEINNTETTDIPVNNKVSIEVTASEDGMTGFIKLTKESDTPDPITPEELTAELNANQIVYGIKESSVEKLAVRPIYNIKIEVAKGLYPVDGEDGDLTYYVKRDMDYHPEYSLEGIIDYKNLDYFQLVKKDQVLCEIKKETDGTEGMNIFGGVVPAKQGKRAPNPVGKNTILIEDDTKLVAECDGVVRFLRDTVDINDMLKVPGNVDQLSGNINFTGDVTIEGDVCAGFHVKSNGNVIVKGVVEDAAIEAGGNVHIAKGINGGLQNKIVVGGDLKCKYIENATIHVEGNISADYIIESRITCMGNIELAGSRELIVGGETKVLGELKAKDIGAENERTTKIEVLGVKIIDNEAIERATAERDEISRNAQELFDSATKLTQLNRFDNNEDLMEQLTQAKRQMLVVRDKLEQKNNEIKRLEDNWTMEYPGAIVCKRKLYQGVKISFGEERFRFNFDNIEHCRIFFSGGQIIQGTL